MAQTVSHFHGVDPAYDWNAFHNGNPIQKWWKRKIARLSLLAYWSAEHHLPDFPTVLNVGCGTSPLNIYVPNMVGTDIDRDKIDFIRERDAELMIGRWPNQFLQANIADRWPFADASFDIGMAIEVAEHVPASPFWDEFQRVVKPGGFLIIATPDYGTWRWHAIEWLYKRLKPGQYCDDHITQYTEASLRAEAAARGFIWHRTERVFGCDMVALFRKVS